MQHNAEYVTVCMREWYAVCIVHAFMPRFGWNKGWCMHAYMSWQRLALMYARAYSCEHIAMCMHGMKYKSCKHLQVASKLTFGLQLAGGTDLHNAFISTIQHTSGNEGPEVNQ